MSLQVTPWEERNVNILLVDDHEGVRSALRSLLAAALLHAVVTESTNGEDAVDTAATVLPEVVLTGLRPPCMDGLEATRIILDRHPSARVLILSGSDTTLHRQRGAAAGAAAFLTKPILGRDLVVAVRHGLADEASAHRGGPVDGLA